MVKFLLFFFLIFEIFQFSTSLSSTSCDLNFDPYYDYFKCDVKTEFKEIYNGKICSNLHEVKGFSSILYDEKIYLEIINNSIIKQWTITDISQNYTVIDLEGYQICDIRVPNAYDWNVDFLFENSLGTFYTSWNLYLSNLKTPSVTHLTNKTDIRIITSEHYIMLVDFKNDTVTEQLFSKSKNAFIEFYELKHFQKKIAMLEHNIINASILIVTFKDGTNESVSVKYPQTMVYSYSYGKDYGNSYSNYDNTSTSYSSSSSGKYVIIIPIGLILFALKTCVSHTNKAIPDNDDEHPIVEDV